jgi:hypothetical protein
MLRLKHGMAISKKGAYLFAKGTGVALGFIDPSEISHVDDSVPLTHDQLNSLLKEEPVPSEGKEESQSNSGGGKGSNSSKLDLSGGLGAAGLLLTLWSLDQGNKTTLQLNDMADKIDSLVEANQENTPALNAPVSFDKTGEVSFEMQVAGLSSPVPYNAQDALFQSYVSRLSEDTLDALATCPYEPKSIEEITDYLEWYKLCTDKGMVISKDEN